MKTSFLVPLGTMLGLLFITASSLTSPGRHSEIAKDSTNADKGEAIFNRFCIGCHNFRQDGIGPQLGGIAERRTKTWIQNFIRNPQKVLNSGDQRARQLYEKYKTVMPSFTNFTTEELNNITAFLNTQKATGIQAEEEGALSNPVPAAIKLSSLVVALNLVTQFPASSDNGKAPLARITKLDFQPNTAGLFVLDLRGKLYKLTGNKPAVYMDMAVLKPKFIDKPGLATGFGSFAFHPQFNKNGLLYTTHCEPAGSAKADFDYEDSIKVTLQWVLTEWKADDPKASVFAGRRRELLRVNMVAGNHGVQEITFNPLAKPGEEDFGLLYIGVGDGGSVENGFAMLAHTPDRVWGTILRINPTGSNSANGQYGIPPGNPFVSKIATKKHPEIYAFGFRNPHRITWTRKKQMLACNIGHGSIESVNLIVKGHDYGWPIREGNFRVNPFGNLNKVYPLPLDDTGFHVTYPVAQYDHDEGNAISGGYEYWGSKVPQLKGKYLFGDILLGRLFYIDVADLKQGRQAIVKEWKVSLDGSRKSLEEICGSKRVDLHFGRDSDGELYIMTKADGKLYKLVSSSL